MESKLNTKNNGPMDKDVKEETDNQDGEVSQTPNLQCVEKPCDKLATSPGSAQPGSAPVLRGPLDKQEEEPHAIHSFEWCCGDKKPKNFTCNKAGTVEDLLKRSVQFKVIAEKNKNKELVIVRDGKAISSHFPCSLIKNECLNVKYIKAADKPKKSVTGPVRPQRKRPSDELLEFHVLTKGGKNVVKIMRNPALRADFQEITVYAYKGEKVKQALKRDGRLLNLVFQKNCELSDKITEVTTEMSNLVNDLDGKIFKIILVNKASLPDSQSSSLDDAYTMQNESQRSDSDGNQDPHQQSTTTESVNGNTPKEKPKLNASEIILCEIPNSKEKCCQLSSQLNNLVKGMKTQPGPKHSRVQNLFRVEYGKSVQTCREVKTMKKLMELSNSVCHVRINGKAGGSGFLLFDRFVLTNGHVVKNIYNQSTGQLNERVTVHFSYESLDQTEGGQESGAKVEEVAGFEYCCDVPGQEHDWALLKLGAHQKLPDGLLTRFEFLPQSGAICIIGHPDGSVKKIDPCLIIPTDNRKQVVERHSRENPWAVEVEGSHYNLQPGPIHLVTDRFFSHVATYVELNRQALTYKSCFYFGSSGSPVFDEHCNVVAMHTGGFPYRNARGESRSVVEFGHPLSVIIEHIIVQIVERGRFDVLKKYLECSYKHRLNMLTSLKRLVESRNLTAESLKTFFELISQREEPVSMDTD